MSEVKDWHCCGQCKHFELDGSACVKHEENLDPNVEACSDFEPKEGWIE